MFGVPSYTWLCDHASERPADRPAGDGHTASGAARAVPSIAWASTVRWSMARRRRRRRPPAARTRAGAARRVRRRGRTAPPGCRAARDSLATSKPPAPAPRANAALIGVLAWARSERVRAGRATTAATQLIAERTRIHPLTQQPELRSGRRRAGGGSSA